jgi:uncharacterized protein
MNSPYAARLVLGTVQLGTNYGINNTHGQPSEEAAFEILRTAQEAGITLLDTAAAYGASQERIGAFHRRDNQRQSEYQSQRQSGHESKDEGKKFQIITKFHATTNATANATANVTANTSAPHQDLLRSIHETLKVLNVSSLYCWQYHRFADVEAAPELTPQLVELTKRGLVERVGVSVYGNDELAAAIRSPHTRHISVIQLPFNLLDNMRLRGELMMEAKHAGKELHVRSVFLQGLFFADPEHMRKADASQPAHLDHLAHLAHLAPLAPAIARLQNLAESCNLSMQALALRYALQSPADAVLVGVETAAQLAELLAALPEQASAQASAQASSEAALPALLALPPDICEEIEAIVATFSPAMLALLSPANWRKS